LESCGGGFYEETEEGLEEVVSISLNQKTEKERKG
jgi:hypothetical protein